MLVKLGGKLGCSLDSLLLQGNTRHDEQSSDNLSVHDFIARTLPLLELEKNAEVAQVYSQASAHLLHAERCCMLSAR